MILSYSATRMGETVTMTVTSSLSGVVYYHWYLDGMWMGRGTSPTRTFFVAAGEQVRLAVVDTASVDFDEEANNPEPYPARRRLWWIRSLATDCDHYRIEERKDAGDWSTAATVPRDREAWSYQWYTGRLDDLTSYEWRVIPVDRAGNDGDLVATQSEVVVRTPDAPEFTVAWNEGTGRVTYSAA